MGLSGGRVLGGAAAAAGVGWPVCVCVGVAHFQSLSYCVDSFFFFLVVVVFSLFLQTSATNTEQRPLLEEVHHSVAGLAGLLNTGISYFVEIFFNGNEALQSRARDRQSGLLLASGCGLRSGC